MIFEEAVCDKYSLALESYRSVLFGELNTGTNSVK